MSIWILSSAVLAAILAFVLVKPLFEPALGAEAELSGNSALCALLDEKERTLRAVKDLDLDFSMRKISAEELEPGRRALTLEAGRIFEEIKRHGGR